METMKVLLLEEVANILRCSESDVLAEIESGNLKAFKVSGQLRVLESELQRFVSGTSPDQGLEPSSEQKGASRHSIISANAKLLNDLAIQVESIPSFTHIWPDGEPNEYKDPISVTVRQGDRTAYFVIGKARSPRKQLGQLRWRYNVFLSASPRTGPGLISVVDFVGGNNFDEDHLMASLIRHRDGSLVKESDVLPPEYRDFGLVQFNRLVRGPYARSGLAVAANKDDLETMIHHAVIRAIQKGWLKW
jgi:hypothetical protein